MDIFYLPIVRFFIVGGVVYAVGMVLLALLVEKFRVSKERASFVMLIVTLQLSFLLNHFWSFSFVPAEDLAEFLRRWVVYCGARAVPGILEWFGFVVLVKGFRVPYVLASIVVVAVGFTFVYAVSEALIFVER